MTSRRQIDPLLIALSMAIVLALMARGVHAARGLRSRRAVSPS